MTKREKMFSEVVADAIENKYVTKKELATEFSASLITIDRWMQGINKPHPLCQEKVRQFILDRQFAKALAEGEENRKVLQKQMEPMLQITEEDLKARVK